MIKIELTDHGLTDVWVTPAGTVHVDKMGDPVRIIDDELVRKLVYHIDELENNIKQVNNYVDNLMLPDWKIPQTTKHHLNNVALLSHGHKITSTPPIDGSSI